MARWAQGKFIPKNPAKYVGKNTPRYRSSWELQFMQFCDNHDSVMNWASEAMAIPYRHPFTGKISRYVPDFFIVYQNKNGDKLAEIVEIKPRNQSIIESKKPNIRLQQTVAINHAKWAAAMAYCKQQGLTFRVLNEENIFRQGNSANK